MVSAKDKAIKKIMKEFEEFSSLTLKQLDLLEKVLNSDSFTISDDTLSELKTNEKKLNNFEVSIADKIVNTIVLHKPVASDLRSIFACYRMSVDLERIGDLVMNVVKFLEKVKGHEVFVRNADMIDNMLSLSSKMLAKSIISFVNDDKDYAIWTIKNDDVVDELYNKLMKKSILKGKMSDDNKKLLLDFMDIRSIISNIERIADHATNIAEASIYAMEGKDVRHLSIKKIDK